MARIITSNTPFDFQVEQQDIERRRKLADMLQQQSVEPLQGQVVSGHFVAPSPTQYLAKLAQGLTSKNQQAALDERQSALASRYNQALADGLLNYQKASQGTPAETTQIVDDEYGPQTITSPAVPGNRQAALIELLKSGHPMLQQLGISEMTKKPEMPFGKVDPKDYTQESVAKFTQTQNFADLVPARKREFVNGQAVDPFGVEVGTVIPKESNPYSDLVVPDGKGGVVPNQPVIAAKKDIAKSGATNVQVKTDVKTGESLAGQVGPMMKESTIAAEGAVKQVDAAQRIVQAVDTNKMFAGPGASTRLKIAQIGDALGIGGKDEVEKIANTRQTIRGLAELTLQGRKSMRGEGAITESEGALAERAMSGNIDELTPAEIKLLAKASERTARFNYAEHQRKLRVMQENPALQGIAPFYQGPAMPAENAPASTAPANKVRRFNPSTGMIE